MTRSVRIENVSFSYGGTPVLDDVSLDVGAGEFFAFLGPSGSGKTTLLRLIAGFGEPASGRILIGDTDVTGLPPWKRNVGMVFQSYALWPHMTVAKNVAFGLERRKLPRAEIVRKVESALALVGLAGYADRRPAQLSGGQQQRVALARTLAIEPDVLLLDEPLSNLDAQLREEMQFELRRIQRTVGITTIMVTHDQAEALSISDRIVVMEKGVITQVDAPYKLYEHPHNHFISNFVGKSNFLKARAEGDMIALAETAIRFPASGKQVSGELSVFIRPEKVQLVAAGEGHIAGEVTTRYFMGAQWLLGVTTPAGQLSVALPNLGNPPPAEGTSVGLSWNHEDCRILTAGVN